ncbi:24038_t:CDS:1, partial [Racocetra persica]
EIHNINKSIEVNTINDNKVNTINDNKVNTTKEDTVKEDTVKEDTAKEDTVKGDTVKEDAVKEDTVKEDTVKEDTVKEDTINSSLETPLTEDEKINIKYCQEKTCKFLFPYYHREQETRANIHARLYTQLARSLNRTLVLSNVGNSKILACALHPFDFYYDLKAFQKQYPDIRFITQNEFFKWTKERKIRPIAQHSRMIHDNRKNDDLVVHKQKTTGVIEGGKLGRKQAKSFCLDRFNLNITNYKEFHTGIRKFDREAMLKFVTNTLNSLEHEAIMVLNTSPRELFPNISKVIPYSPSIIKESKKIIKKLNPYIAVHWRMEVGVPELMPKCANKLVETLKKVQKKYGITNVYLATDYPLNGNPQSQTFHNISYFHKEAIEILGLNVNSSKHIKFDTWMSMDAFSQIRDDPKYKSEFKSAGIQGILDKLVCMQAKYFLKGPKGCARTSSTFTRTIVAERNKFKNKYNLINIVSYWQSSNV